MARVSSRIAVGRTGRVESTLKPGMLADVIVLERDPLADITVLQGDRHLAWVIKDGKVIDLGHAPSDAERLEFSRQAS